MEDFLRGMQQSTLTTSVLFATPTSIPVIAGAQEALRDTLQRPTSFQHAAAAVATSTSSDNVQLKSSNDSTINGVVIGLLSSFGSAILIALIFLIVYFFKYTSSGRILLDRIGRPGEYDDEQAFAKEEAEALEEMDDLQRTEYLRAKGMSNHYLPHSYNQTHPIHYQPTFPYHNTWQFKRKESLLGNSNQKARTEIEFFDSECCTLTNLPVPKQNEVYYWESKIYDKPENTLISIGVATKPYPLFRLPGWHKYSVAYTSTGQRRYNQPFSGPVYGPQYVQGDVIGVGYRPRTGTIFFTRNGKKLEDVAHGLKTQNLFPAVGANGPCTVHVNFGQSGFVFIEANVKKWGLAPMTGSLAPPPPYGSEQGSILLEAGREGAQSSNGHYQPDPRHGRTRSGNFRHGPPTSPGPIRSPTDISLAQLTHFPSHEEPGEASNSSTPAPTGGATQQTGLGVHDNAQPPPEYTSPLPSVAGNSERTPMLRRKTTPPPIPSYNDAVAQRNRSHSHRDRSGGRRERSDSHRARQGDGNPSQS
ncbi:hypothetical protein BOTCAL_0021g00190 [Botryotinia calthae]|uniref:Protein SSH4 n=1 Tax=Botryotinia calthae TaxID=38488 RepID=A0A4Y8DEQ5_9HELO|nr:hypothetical protein BOTCAL_0021g00190 [Botryotinia calthae]